MPGKWSKAVLFSLLLLVLVALYIGVMPVYRLLYAPMLPKSSKPFVIHLDKYASASDFVHLLKKHKLIQCMQCMQALIRIQGLSHRLKAGYYQIEDGESAQKFLKRVAAGNVLNKLFQVIEGTTKYQVALNLKQAPYLSYKQEDWLVVEGGYTRAEGLLLADTYSYEAGSDAEVLLSRSNAKLNEYLQTAWQQRDIHLPYKSPYEMLIVASILEKETAIPEEKRLIAGVIVNRLHKRMPLQVDPTVIYGLKTQYKGQLTKDDLKIDTPYNTYLHRGLPPTPIAMVGKDAIDAAAHPKITDYIYFVAKGDGSHKFSVTYDEQRQAIKQFLRNNDE